MKAIKLLALLCVTLSFSLTSCSKDDNNDQMDPAKWIKNQVYDENGEMTFLESDVEGVYLFPVTDKETAHSLCCSIINKKFEGSNYVYNLPDNKGSVTIKELSEEGHYYSLDFKVVGIPTFQGVLLNVEALKSKENGSNSKPFIDKNCKYFKCDNCGWASKNKPSNYKCPECGNKVRTVKIPVK